MNVDVLVDAIGQVDDEFLGDVDDLRKEKRAVVIYRPWLVAASIVLIMAIGIVAGLIKGDLGLNKMDITFAGDTVEQGIYVDGELYSLGYRVYFDALQEYSGKVIGRVSFDGSVYYDAFLYEYGADGKQIDKILVAYEGDYYLFVLNKSIQE
ncbi:MAG: hypothetical protein IKC38_02380 [Clostridia bacterium]|nr:hypothetical protein [Clostridia bacterium]